MPFWRPEFFILLSCCLLSMRLCTGHSTRKLVLIAAGLYFYAWWDYRFLSLLPGLALIDWMLAKAIARAARPTIPLAAGIAVHLLVLAFFKYSAFFLRQFGEAALPESSLWLILPLGLSFQQFQAITYLAAVRSGDMEPRKSYLDVLAFTSFFPCLTAGPIPRAKELMPQLSTLSAPTAANLYAGLSLFAAGLFKKLVLADRLGPYVHEVFSNPALFDGPTVWGASLAYALQIYLDFSGYSDMAIGTATALGVRLPDNFNFPYLARNISDFWRRWHISLSTWLRDYLYIPLGGNRHGFTRTLANVMIVMALCGIWHGSGWTFLFWGGLHGLGLCIFRIWRATIGKDRQLPDALAMGTTFLFVMLCWIPFRADSLDNAMHMFRALAGGGTISWLPHSMIAIAIVTAEAHLCKARSWVANSFSSRPGWLQPACVFTLIWLTILFHAKGFTPFIYARF